MGYFGSKAAPGLCQAIISLMPPHDVYIEAFLGGGAIMKRKPPAERSIGIDLAAAAVGSFRCGHPVELHHGCALRFLAAFPFRGSELVYCDPPYLRATRRSRRRYRFDWSEADHVALLDRLKALPCRAMASGHPSALYDETLYDETLSDWWRLEMQVMTHGVVRTEVVWFNFVPDRVHWADCAGRNFTDRQRIKRKAANWGRMYKAMPLGERLAVLAAVMVAEADIP